MYRNQKGVGDEIGEVMDKNGKVINGGRILVKELWNSWFYDLLLDVYYKGKSFDLFDVYFYKNRSLGMCDRMKDVINFINEYNLRMLFFIGINID